MHPKIWVSLEPWEFCPELLIMFTFKRFHGRDEASSRILEISPSDTKPFIGTVLHTDDLLVAVVVSIQSVWNDPRDPHLDLLG